MRRDSFNRNNKGIALVSIVIAVAMLSIIGATLLSITYTNFQMKSTNIRSKENFYETDGVLMDVVVGLRNGVDSPKSVEDKIVDPAVADPTDTTPPYLDISSFVETSLSDNSDLEKVEINEDYVVYRDKNTNDYFYVSYKLNPIKTSSANLDVFSLSGLEVKQKSDKGYVNTINTDMELHVRTITGSGNSRKGVGEFSMMLDAPITLEDGKFPFVTFYGDCYFSSYNYDNGFKEFPVGAGNSYTCPGGEDKPAIKLYDECKMNCIGENCNVVVYGDIVLNEQSCLYIPSGKLTVYGNIYLNDQSTLISEAEIYMPQDYLPGRSDYCGIYTNEGTIEDHFYSSKVDFGTNTEYRVTDGTKIHPLTQKNVEDFCGLLALANADKTDDGIVNQIIRTDVNYNGTSTYNLFSVPGINQIANLSQSKHNTTYYGKNTSVMFAKEGSNGKRQINANELIDSLCFVMNERDNSPVGGGSPTPSTPTPSVTKTAVSLGASDFLYASDLNGLKTAITNEKSQGGKYGIELGTDITKVTDGSGWPGFHWTGTYYLVEGSSGGTGGTGGTGGSGYAALEGSNINSTIISICPVHLEVDHGVYVSKMGSDLYNFLTETPAGDAGKDKAYYDTKVHNFDFEIGGYSNNQKASDGKGYAASSFLKSNANSICQQMMDVSVGGGGGTNKYINSVHFKNYVKDAQ